MVIAQLLRGVDDPAQINAHGVRDDVYIFERCVGRINVFDALYVLVLAEMSEQFEMSNQPFRPCIFIMTKHMVSFIAINGTYCEDYHILAFEPVESLDVQAVQAIPQPFLVLISCSKVTGIDFNTA